MNNSLLVTKFLVLFKPLHNGKLGDFWKIAPITSGDLSMLQIQAAQFNKEVKCASDD